MKKTEEAIEVLNSGGIVVFPTDTAFGIGCRIDNEQATRRLFQIRRRPFTKAVPVLVDSIEMAEDYLWSPLPNNVRHLMKRYWPGGLTIIYNCRIKRVPELVRGSGETLGIRLPNHKVTISLIKGTKVPILGPSANFHGESTPYLFRHLDDKFIKLVDYVLEGECLAGKSSTVIDCSAIPWKIIRHGAIEIDKIKQLKHYEDEKNHSLY